jgi:hypothetical protein
MANTLAAFNPQFYANEALIQLEKALGMAGRVYRGYETERNSFGRGDTINIPRPSTFTAQNGGGSDIDISAETVSITLDQWKEVKFALTDQELAYTGQRIIDEHIRPAAYALADNIDQALAALYMDVPWIHNLNAAASLDVTDIIDVRRVMFDNNVPVADFGNMHYMIDGAIEAEFLGLTAFSQQQGAGDMGVNTQMRGSLGMKFGVEVFANQNTPAHTGGTISDTTPVLDGALTAGATTMNIDDTALTGTVVPGDTFVFAGTTQRYAVTNTVTAATNAMTGITFTPPLVEDIADDTGITVDATTTNADALMFHRNAFALCLAPLPTTGDGLGARIAVASDPITGLALRSRLWYDGNTSKVKVGLDVLYGVKTLDPNLACRGQFD